MDKHIVSFNVNADCYNVEFERVCDTFAKYGAKIKDSDIRVPKCYIIFESDEKNFERMLFYISTLNSSRVLM